LLTAVQEIICLLPRN